MKIVLSESEVKAAIIEYLTSRMQMESGFESIQFEVNAYGTVDKEGMIEQVVITVKD